MIGITDQSDYSLCHFMIRLFIHTVGNFSSHQKVGKIYFSSDCFVVMVTHISILIYLSHQFNLINLLDEVVYVERINEKFTIEVKILRQKNGYFFKMKEFICYRSQRI